MHGFTVLDNSQTSIGAITTFTSTTARYLRLRLYNDNRYGNGSYVELYSFKLFNVPSFVPSIPNTDLLLYFDAANVDSYPGSGTTWANLATYGASRNATLVSGATYSAASGGAIVFNGSTQYATLTTSSVSVTGGTFIAWLYPTATQDVAAGIISNRAGSTSNFIFYSYDGRYLSYIWNGAANTYGYNSNLQPPLNQWSMCAVSVSSTQAKFYMYTASGLQTAINTVSHGSSTFNSTIELAKDAGRYFTGRNGISILYGRTLTDSEIASVYALTKTRFGL